jgi:hypothetical protein
MVSLASVFFLCSVGVGLFLARKSILARKPIPSFGVYGSQDDIDEEMKCDKEYDAFNFNIEVSPDGEMRLVDDDRQQNDTRESYREDDDSISNNSYSSPSSDSFHSYSHQGGDRLQLMVTRLPR